MRLPVRFHTEVSPGMPQDHVITAVDEDIGEGICEEGSKGTGNGLGQGDWSERKRESGRREESYILGLVFPQLLTG